MKVNNIKKKENVCHGDNYIVNLMELIYKMNEFTYERINSVILLL